MREKKGGYIVTSLTIEEEKLWKLKELLAKRHQSMNAFLNEMIEKEIKKNGK